MQEVIEAFKLAVSKVTNQPVDIELTRPDPKFGDFASNIALQLNKKLKNPSTGGSIEIARQIITHLPVGEIIEKAEVAGPGFINIRLSDTFMLKIIDTIDQNYGSHNTLEGQKVVTEYLDPNLFKELHIGHAYSGTIGDAISSILENCGAKVHRVTYQGDIGLHVAKAMYGIWQQIDSASDLKSIPPEERSNFLAQSYVTGAAAYEDDESAKQAINQLNVQLYKMNDAELKKVYETGKIWSLEYFESIYKEFDFTPFEKNYLESQSAPAGTSLVKEHIGDVFEESHGAIIFRGEKYGLHTRVFINSRGLPTYEAKDLGLPGLKDADFNPDISIIITANEQTEYFAVMLKALEQFNPSQAHKTKHIPHGIVKLSSGKMSSRTGKVVKAADLLEAARQAAHEIAKQESSSDAAALGAIKYTFLKNRIGGDITFDMSEAVSLEGNSGPYLQYSHARAKSIISKADSNNTQSKISNLEPDERLLLRKISEYPEVTIEACQQYAPHIITNFLYEIAQEFNRFYEKNRIIGHERESIRLQLVIAYAHVLKHGLSLLHIPAPDSM